MIVWLHGGGFRTGSSRTQGYIVTYSTEFAKRGYVCLAVDYRLRDAADMPTQESELPAEQDAASDCNTAFNWIRTNGAAYAINPNWMFVAGGSAGGRTACVFSFHEGPDTNVCGGCTSAILTNGVNLVPPVNWNRTGVIANAGLWGSPEPVMRWYVLDSNDVPTVIFQGTADGTIDYQNAVDLYNGLTNAGVTDGTGNDWKKSRAELAAVILTGVRRPGDKLDVMPAWKGRMSDQDIEDVLNYLQSLWPPEVYEAWHKTHPDAAARS